MSVEFLGTGGYHPNERRHTASILIPDSGVLLDAGSSCFRVPDRLRSDELRIFLSHAHLDHIIGLTFLLAPLVLGRIQRVHLYGSEATLDAVRNHLFAPAVFPVLPAFQFLVLDDADCVMLPDGGRVSHQPLRSHPGGSTAYRIDWPPQGGAAARSLAYVTDTRVDGSYTDFIRGVDLLIHECYFTDDHADWAAKTGHSVTTAVARVAREAGVGQLALTHIDPQRADDDPVNLELARSLHPQTFVAEDLQRWEWPAAP